MSEVNSGLSRDTQALMAFEASKKSAGVAYLLWFFTGGFGGHRFYLGRTGSAVAQLILSLLGWVLLLAAGIGLLFLIPLGIWLLVDLFLIPGIIQGQNGDLMRRLDASASASAHRTVSAVDELGKFATLRDQGAITEAEFEVQKARLLGTSAPVTSPAV